MRNYAETCKGICGFAIKKFTFCGGLFKRILAWERGTSKT